MKLTDAILSTSYRALSGTPALFWALLALFVVVNILDGHSTYLVLKPHYYERERNPVARWAFRKLGLPRGIIIFKVLLLAILIPAMAFYGGNDLFTINIVLIVSNVVFVFVVRHNYRVHKKIRGLR
ncbi:MAG: DUF5658 family protein [Candidatus Cloacimonetes bacterium]|nr:DUF5658 family protein [Candidatus Cloacimonadota bacterium]